MALIRKQGPRFQIGSSVASRIEAVKAAKSRKRLAEETKFLTLVNEGSMSYDDQVAYREGQIAAEKASASPNNDYIAELTKDLGSLKSLAAQKRFSDEYADSFDEVTAGRKTLQSHVDFLEKQLAATNNPTLRSDIRQKLTQARTDLRAQDETALENFVTYAQNSKEMDILDQALTRVTSERTKALAQGDDDYASVLQLKEQSLKQARSLAGIEYKNNQIKLNALKNPHPVRTLDFITKSVDEAADSGPIVVDGKRYDSERDYWVQARGNYVAGGDLFKDLKDYYGKWIGNALERNPELAASIILQSKDTFAGLRTRPELNGFEVQLDDAIGATVGKGARDLAKLLIDNAQTTYDFQSAADRIADISKMTGMDLSTESNQLIRLAAGVQADVYQAIVTRANELEGMGMSRAQATAEALRSFQTGEVTARPVSPKELATKTPEQLLKESETPATTEPIKTGSQTPAPPVETRQSLETTTRKVEGGEEVPATVTTSGPDTSSTTTVTNPPVTPPVVAPQVQPAAAPVPKKMATLANLTTGDRQAVEVDSPRAKELFGQGYELEIKPPKT